MPDDNGNDWKACGGGVGAVICGWCAGVAVEGGGVEVVNDIEGESPWTPPMPPRVRPLLSFDTLFFWVTVTGVVGTELMIVPADYYS